MVNDISRIIIETTAKNTLKDIQDDPERSIRKVVDMALTFSGGRFQQRLFKTAQKMLSNEQSAYYDLIKDTVAYVHTNRLLTFGMNLGYNSCTIGARTIRQIEDTSHFNIPWCLSLAIDTEAFPENEDLYHNLIIQGKKLGIYTWLLYCTEFSSDVLSLISEFGDCAFLLFCSGEKLDDEFMKKAATLHNLMFVIKYDSAICGACAKLRQQHFLYSVYVPYVLKDVESILNDNLLHNIEKLHPVFTFFQADATCPLSAQEKVYQYILATRSMQNHSTFPMDLIFDNLFIDSIISTDSCIAGFNAAGQLYSLSGTSSEKEYNLRHDSLNNILKLAFPKQA